MPSLMTSADSATVRRVTEAADPEWLRIAADAGRVGFWRLDIASGSIDCTPRCKANLGIPEGTKVTIDVIWSVMHPGDREHVGAIVRHAMETQSAYGIEYRAVWPDGSVHWIASRGCYAEIDGQPSMVGSTIDETERRRVEEMNRLITTHVAEGICFMNAEGRVTFLNPAAEKILGYSADELCGRILHEVVHYKRSDGSPYPMSECPLGQTLTEGVAITDHEDLLIHKDGHFVPLIVSSTPIAEEGSITGSVVSLHDITERKVMEDALREASRARDEFLATVSHELRTPMTAILGWAQLMKIGELEPELRTAVEQIELSAKAQAAIVDDLIDVSRAVTGKLRLNVARIDAVTVLNEATQVVEATAAAKRIRLDRIVECGSASIIADRNRLHQVFWNLLSNAIKFTPENGRVEMRLACTSDRLTVAVTDTGIGIAPQFLPHVFDRFSQQSGATSRMHGGLGLGLAIVKQFVEMHGGTVSASSDGPGKGATFTLTLPRG
jgi:PAS domain S-box-containing protein